VCGRFTQTNEEAVLRARFGFKALKAKVEPRYNIAPTDPVLVLVQEAEGLTFEEHRWGLLRATAKSPKSSPRPINARVENLAVSRMFRDLLPIQRCLVVADGFYEWGGPKERRQPYRVHLKTDEPFTFAGLWDAWRDPAGGELRTCTIVTTAANDLVRPIHDRMPVILYREAEARWLDPGLTSNADLLRLLVPRPVEELEVYPVSTEVNSVRAQGPECIARVA
jgi:putative SOS response-associated peptidase YedK